MYDLVNNGGRSIEVEDIALDTHSRGLRLIGARAQTAGVRWGGAAQGFPPRNVTSVPVKGLVLGPHESRPLMVGLQADGTGDYLLMGVKVEYRVRYLEDYGPRYRRTLTTTMAVCAQARPVRARTELCDPPEMPIRE
jgi:hypothetical protein